MKTPFSLLATLVLLTGCSTTVTQGPAVFKALDLDTNGLVLVYIPEDAREDENIVAGSGRAVALSFSQALNQRFTRAEPLFEPMSLDRALQLSRDRGAKYLVAPAIMRWEDNATEWSGKKDKVDVEVRILDTNGTLIDLRKVGAKSKWATWGGDHPMDLIPHLATNYAAHLFDR